MRGVWFNKHRAPNGAALNVSRQRQDFRTSGRSRAGRCGQPHLPDPGLSGYHRREMSILIAEDNVAQRAYLREILERDFPSHQPILEAADGEETVAMALKNKIGRASCRERV